MLRSKLFRMLRILNAHKRPKPRRARRPSELVVVFEHRRRLEQRMWVAR